MIDKITMSINSRCNLRCKMCDVGQHALGSGLVDNWMGLPELPAEYWVAKLNQIGPGTIAIQGTEPLLYAGLHELLDGIRVPCVNITTNGWHLEQHAKALSSRCSSVAVSVDGHTAEVHDAIRGVPGSFDRALAGILAMKSYSPGAKVRISCAITPDNYQHVHSIYRLFREQLGLSVTFNHYNYIHPTSCVGYGCSPSNLSIYDPADIIPSVLFEQITRCTLASFLPNLRTVQEVRRYYHEPPTKLLAGAGCAVLKRIARGNLMTLASDGNRIISARCWIVSGAEDTWPELLARAQEYVRRGLPPPCQRLCCGGKTV